MKSYPDIADVAALMGEPARAAILVSLLDGRALPATDLAARVDLAPSTVSEHLRRLVEGGLLLVERQGRHRYYRLAGPTVALAIEALGTIGRPSATASEWEAEMLHDLRVARSCYDHLAGQLGVAITDALLARQFLAEDGSNYYLTTVGTTWFTAFGVDLATARKQRRIFARRCLDWSERRPHLAGALGAALLAKLLTEGWLTRQDGERALLITPVGVCGLQTSLGIRVPEEATGTMCATAPS